MKRRRIIPLVVLSLALVGFSACNPEVEEVTQQIVKVTRDDLTTYVRGSGNIAIAREAKLTFGVAGKVEEILVKEGASVKAGDMLARIETNSLELALGQAKIAETQAKVTLETAELALSKAEKTYVWPELKKAQADVDEGESALEYAYLKLSQAVTSTEIETWMAVVARAQVTLATAEARLEAQLQGDDTEEVALKKSQVEAARESLTFAQLALKQAQKQLNEATMTAPFDGIIAAKVDVRAGDTVSTVTRIVHLVDLTSLELKIEVDEIDIPDVQIGQAVNIGVDALPNAKFEGRVASISSFPLVVSGLVSYPVTIGLTNPDPSVLRIGMSATANIITNQRSNTLLIPTRALTDEEGNKATVKVMVNGQVEERSVTLGLGDSFQTEIISGLQEGEEVVIEIRPRPTPAGGLF